MWMMSMILAAVLTVVAGCGGATQPSDGDRVGDLPSYIEPSECAAPARKVVEAGGLKPVHTCTAAPLAVEGGGTAHYVLVQYGEAMDCPSGCIYDRKAAVVSANRVDMLDEPFPLLEQLRYSLGHRLGIALPEPLDSYTSLALRQEGGQWHLVVTFTEHLEGALVLAPGADPERIPLTVTPRSGTLTRERLQSLVWQKVSATCAAAGATVLGFEAQPLNSDGWQGTLVWGKGDDYVKTPFAATAGGDVTLPQGCDPRK